MDSKLTFPYHVRLETVEKQLGLNGLDNLNASIEWLCKEDAPETLSFRVAPSMVVRSEAELFGISSPRFAFRVNLPDGGFINTRRLEVLARNIRAAHGDVGGKALNKALTQLVVDRGLAVADSVLKLPKHLRNAGFRALQVELGRAYGEGVPVRGTPFLQHIHPGGGMCAQAACFMALSLCWDVAKSIYGIAEITKLASAEEQPTMLEIGGMTDEDIVHFFARSDSGLRAFHESVYEQDSEPNHSELSLAMVRTALTSYVRSGFPVVLLVDMGRMATILERNAIPFDLQVRPGERANHAVVLVGHHETDGDRYLLNDPATCPFLTASFEEIFDARQYIHVAAKIEPTTPLRAFSYIPVVPKAVKMPLMQSVDKGVASVPFGALQIADALHTSSKQYGGYEDLKSPIDEYEPGEWRLVSFAQDDPNRLRTKLSWLPGNVADWVAQAVEGGKVPSAWHWIQFRRPKPEHSACVLLWNAEHEPYSMNRLHEHLSSYKFFADLSAANAPIAAGCQAMSPPERLGLKDLSMSLLSSFCTAGATRFGVPTNPERAARVLSPFSKRIFGSRRVSQLVSPMPQLAASAREIAGEEHPHFIPAEVYMMMEEEVKEWVKYFKGKVAPLPTAVEFLAGLEKDQVEAIAACLSDLFHRESNPIVALASFVPEIACPEDSTQGKQGIGAIRTLVAIARELQKNHGHPTQTVELVAGSLIAGLVHRATADETFTGDTFFAHMLTDKQARSQVLTNLRAVTDGLTDPGLPVFLAVELEPGPIFTVRNEETLDKFFEELMDPEKGSQWKDLQSCLGVNVDISHYRIAGVKLDAVRRLRTRIVHAHISGHTCRGHFGDLSPYELNDPADYEPWLRYLDQLAQKQKDEDVPNALPRFSGHVSLELEAAKNWECVAASYAYIHGLR